MAKITTKITFPIILTGIFIIVIFLALSVDYRNPAFELFVIVCLAIFVFFFGLAAGQSISSPVKKILDNATEINKGNLSSRVYLDTKDELSELADALNKMAERLEASYQENESIEKSTDIKVKAKTKELEEIIYALEQKVRNRTAELEKKTEELERLKQSK